MECRISADGDREGILDTTRYHSLNREDYVLKSKVEVKGDIGFQVSHNPRSNSVSTQWEICNYLAFDKWCYFSWKLSWAWTIVEKIPEIIQKTTWKTEQKLENLKKIGIFKKILLLILERKCKRILVSWGDALSAWLPTRSNMSEYSIDTKSLPDFLQFSRSQLITDIPRTL